jgi:hypothetical protein
MSDLTDRFFSPLGKEWCIYYFAILVFVFIFFVLSIISAVIGLFNLKKIGFNEIYLLCVPIVMNLILYLQSRIIYSICVSSLK